MGSAATAGSSTPRKYRGSAMTRPMIPGLKSTVRRLTLAELFIIR